MQGGETRILVVKLGALGDFILALGAMQAIRRYHAGAQLNLLTTAALAPLAESAGLFDEICLDERAPPWRPGG